MTTAPQFGFDNSYQRLPERFYARLPPEPVSSPRLVALNLDLARTLGLDGEALGPESAAIFSGNRLPADATPIALAYAGHQFGSFVPQLGDGRAILLGEVIDSGRTRRDIQLKGSGRTPFSRRGDGRAALGPVLREYLVSEAMHALGIPTTRALAAVTTGEPVFREEALPGAVLTRVAASHIRVGTFQYFAVRADLDGVRRLADHVIARHYPEVGEADRPYLALLDAVAARQASLIARWMQIGFVHGVMNTDNTAVSGETIDYGPCAFMDAYDPRTVFSSIDAGGRYAFANQPAIAQWNLARFAETLLPLIDDDRERSLELATAAVSRFAGLFEERWLDGMRRKLGLASDEPDDRELIGKLLDAMHQGAADFTLTFRGLCDLPEDAETAEAVRLLFSAPALFDGWAGRWRDRLAREPLPPTERASRMRAVNPAYIPRNHRVEEVLGAAVQDADFGPFETLHRVLAQPYTEQPGMERWAEPPAQSDRVYRTFCGT